MNRFNTFKQIFQLGYLILNGISRWSCLLYTICVTYVIYVIYAIDLTNVIDVPHFVYRIYHSCMLYVSQAVAHRFLWSLPRNSRSHQLGVIQKLAQDTGGYPKLHQARPHGHFLVAVTDEDSDIARVLLEESGNWAELHGMLMVPAWVQRP